MGIFGRKYTSPDGTTKRRGNPVVAFIIIAVVVIIAIAGFNSYTIIPTGHTGVVTTFGQVENFTLDAGVHFKLPWQNVVKMDNRIQKQTIDMTCFSSDIQEVSMTYTVNYQINKANAMEIYKTIGINYYDTVISPCISEAIKVVSAKYNAEELISTRADLAAAAEAELATRLKGYNIELVSTSIENLDFTDAFTDAVEAKQVAEQNKLRAQTEADQKKIEAEAEAEVRRIEADAKAYEILKQAEAEAEANKMVVDSLTEEILEKMFYDNWDGKLPTVYGGSGELGTMIDVPIG